MIASEYEISLINEKIKKILNQDSRVYRIIIFGCTPYARNIKDAVESCGRTVEAIIDNAREKLGKSMGIPIVLPQDYLFPLDKDYLIIVCSKFHQEMIGQLKEYGYKDENIVNIFVDECRDGCQDMDASFQKAKQDIMAGLELYSEICAKYGETDKMFLCPYPGTGDIYMACSLLGDYLLREGISNYIFVVVGNNCRRIAKLFHTMNIEVVDNSQMRLLLNAWTFLTDKMNIKPLLHWNWRTKRFLHTGKHQHITFSDMFQFDVFENEKPMPYRHFKPVYGNESVRKIFKENSLIKGRTVVLAPYAGSFVADIKKEDWECIANQLKSKGYTVCTNSSGEKEPAVQGTVPVFFPYDEAIEFLEYAGGLIAFRSGLCDVVSQARCKMLILYENNYSAANMEHFGLKNMGLRDDVTEMMWTKETLQVIDNMFEPYG